MELPQNETDALDSRHQTSTKQFAKKLRVEFDIARRLSQRKGGTGTGVMERVATVATAVSLMVMVVTLSVVVGFKQDIDHLLSGATADIVVSAPQSRGVVSSVRIERDSTIESLIGREPSVVRYSPYIAKEGVLKSDENIVGILLKGIDSLYDTSFYKEHIVEGTLPRVGETPRRRDIIISERVAKEMDVSLGDRVEMVVVDDNGGILRDRFNICGIFHTGIDVVDGSLVLTDMRNVARLYDGNDRAVTGYELWLDERADAASVARRLNKRFVDLYFETGINGEAYALQQIYPEIFGWLATHDVNAVVVVVIMVVVALLNMITSLLITVLERRRMIGELRAMGARRMMVVRVFMFRALIVVVRGVVWGLVLGIALCVVQHLWAPIPLPEGGYILSRVPAAMCWGWWALAAVVTVAVTMVVMTLPALLSARVSPADSMRSN